MKELKITPKGQIVIPKELREELNLKPGEKLIIKKVGRKLILIPKPKDPVKFLLTIAKKAKLGNLRKDIKEFRRE